MSPFQNDFLGRGMGKPFFGHKEWFPHFFSRSRQTDDPAGDEIPGGQIGIEAEQTAGRYPQGKRDGIQGILPWGGWACKVLRTMPKEQ